MRMRNLLALMSLFIIAACSDKEEPLEELTVELTASSETVNYGETFTLTWSSNASQCYAQGRWSGEKPTSGSEEIENKRGGDSPYVLECRRNNEFKNQAVTVTIIKTVADYFIFSPPADEPDFVIEYAADEKVNFSSEARGDFNDDNLPDVVFGVQVRKIADNSLVQSRLIQFLGAPLPLLTEVANDDCDAISSLTPKDLDGDGFTDLIATTTDYERQNLGVSKVCFFKGAETGLALDNEFVTNDTNLDLANADVRIAGLIDRNNNAVLDIYLLTSTNEYWIEIGAEDGPKLEEFQYDGALLADQTITNIAGFDFNVDSNPDVVFATYDSADLGRLISVPKSGDGTNWAEGQVYENVPTLKNVTFIEFDQDEFLDVFVMGDTAPTNFIDPSATSTFKVYEAGEVSILENETDIDFSLKSVGSLNHEIIQADYDQDFDGGDILVSFLDFGEVTAKFLVVEKQETTDEDDVTTYQYVANTDEELNLENVPVGQAFTVFIDYNRDFDIDVLFIEKGEPNTETGLTPLRFFIQENQSN